ncbi:major facilitator superfamily domain-containing protein, partial [Cerioporus squamosus]
DSCNVSNAWIAGLQQTLGISDEQVHLYSSIYRPLIVMQIPSNFLMIVVGPHVLLPIFMILQGLSSALQGVATTYPAFVACRILVTLFEGALVTGCMVYLSCFYPRRMLELRMSIIFASLTLSPSISSLLAAGIVRMDGLLHRSGYAWIFLLEGVAAVAFGLIRLLIMPKSPSSIFFLQERDKQIVASAMVEDSCDIEANERGRFWYELGHALVQPHVLLNALAGFLVCTFLPTIVAGLGFKGTNTQLMSVPPFAIGAACNSTPTGLRY